MAQGWTLNGASRAGNANFFTKLWISFASLKDFERELLTNCFMGDRVGCYVEAFALRLIELPGLYSLWL